VHALWHAEVLFRATGPREAPHAACQCTGRHFPPGKHKEQAELPRHPSHGGYNLPVPALVTLHEPALAQQQPVLWWV
jgi:hypothetical protein